MPQQIRREDVRKAIASKPIPQTYEQIASGLERSLALPKDSVSPQSLSRTVKVLVEAGDVVTVTDRTLLKELGAFPQHYGGRTKFFLAIEVARERIAADMLQDPQETAPAANRQAPSRPAAAAPAAPSRKPATRKTARAAAAASAAAPQSVAEPDVKQGRHLRAVTADPDLLATKLAATPHAFTPAFSAAPNTTGPVRSADEVLADVTKHVAAVLARTAATLQREVDSIVLPENRRWHNDEFGADGQRVAKQLKALYEMATSNASALNTDAAMLTRGAPRRQQPSAGTGTC